MKFLKYTLLLLMALAAVYITIICYYGLSGNTPRYPADTGQQYGGTENAGSPDGWEGRHEDSSSEPNRDTPVEIEGLVKVQDIDSDIVVELRYATDNNFTGKKIYPVSVCVLRKETAEKLKRANQEFMEKGYRIKVWDAYRPYRYQQVLWDAAADKRFVADPTKGSNHNRGAAVDITLVDRDGKELEMPTGFDEFTERASRNYQGMSQEARENLDYLTGVMRKHGFTTINSEWWHFNDSDCKNYPVLDIPLEKFVNMEGDN